MKRLIKDIIDSKIYFILFVLIFILSFILILTQEKAFLIEFLDKNRTDFLNHVFIFLTKIGEYYTFFFFFFYFLYKKSRISFSIMFMGALMPIISYVLKQYFKHPRPFTYYQKTIDHVPVDMIENFHYHTGHNSFPSGHTMAAFSIFTLLALFTKNKFYQFIYFLLAFLVGLSRIYLVQHFLEDVVFGASLGVIIGILSYHIFKIVLAKKSFLDLKLKSSKDKTK